VLAVLVGVRTAGALISVLWLTKSDGGVVLDPGSGLALDAVGLHLVPGLRRIDTYLLVLS